MLVGMSETTFTEHDGTLRGVPNRVVAGDRVVVVREDGAAFEVTAKPFERPAVTPRLGGTLLEELAWIEMRREDRGSASATSDAVDDVRRVRGWTEEEVLEARRDEGRG